MASLSTCHLERIVWDGYLVKCCYILLNKSDQPSLQNNTNNHTQPAQSKAKKTVIRRTSSFRPKRSTTELIFNIRLLIEKHVDHQYIYHLNRHLVMCGTKDSRVMRQYNINEGRDSTRIAIWTINECSFTRRINWTIVSNIGRSTPGMPLVASAVQPIPSKWHDINKFKRDQQPPIRR